MVSADTVKGKVTGSGSYTYLTQVKVSATAKYGYHFTQWNDGDTNNPRVVTLLGDTSFMASFAPNSYQLTLASSDTVKGNVSGSGNYAYLSKVKISATAKYGYHFTQWNDGDTTNPRVVTVAGDMTLTASFAVNRYQINVASNDTYMGLVSGSGSYAFKEPATLAAIATAHHHFLHWNDGNRMNPRTITVNGDSSFTAIFAVDTHKVTIHTNDSAMGVVTGGGEYAYDVLAVLKAVADANHHFVHWSDGDTTNPRLITVTGDVTLMAFFEANNYQLSAISADTMKGRTTGSGTYKYLSKAKISATPKYGYHFTQWNDGDTNNPRVVTLKGDTSFTASFAANSYQLSVVSGDTVKGRVSGSGSYTYLSQVKISATANYGYHFTQWNDGDTNNPRVVTLKGDTSFTFRRQWDVCRQEVIEFGAVKLGEDLSEIDSFRKLVKPAYGDIPPRYQRLTGISNDMVAEAPDFETVLAQFAAWCDDAETVYAWSGSDLDQLRGEVRMKEIAFPLDQLTGKWADFQKIFTRAVGLKRELSLEQAVNIADIDFAGHQHDALWDARNTAELYRIYRDEKRFNAVIGPLREAVNPKKQTSFTLADALGDALKNLNLPEE